MPYINVDEAYILDNTGLQVDNSVDYANANANRNLLDNPFFTVNQRSFSSGAATAAGLKTVDRWEAIRAGVTLNSDGSLTVTPSEAQYGLVQYIEPSRLKVGNRYTMSAIVDGEILSGSFVFQSATYSAGYFATFSNGIRFYSNYGSDKLTFWVIRSSTTAYTVSAVKLELGSYSTLANDVPPDYGEELRKCQRYFVRVPLSTGQACATGFANSTTSIRFLIPVPTTMRSSPSVAITGSSVANGNGAQLTISAFNTPAVLATCGVTCACTVSGATQYQSYSLSSTNTTSYIDLSADL